MAKYGRESKKQLATCHPDWSAIMNIVVTIMDNSVIEGHRNEHDQNKYFDKGTSKVRYPNGKHNTLPSMAIDTLPYPKKWKATTAEFYLLAGIIIGVAEMLFAQGIITHKVRHGGDWNKDRNTTDQKFYDLAHFELY